MRKFLRPAVFVVTALLLFVFTDTLLWLAALLLALFYFGIDVFHIDKANPSPTAEAERYPAHNPGVFGHYEIDSTPSYGLFLSLAGKPVFIDIREDKLLEKRKEFARFLSENVARLESNLNEFIQTHPDYSSKQIASIGLHAEVLDQGEVFWFPNGYTRLKGLMFSE